MDAFGGSQDEGVKCPLSLVLVVVIPGATVQSVLCGVLHFDEKILDIIGYLVLGTTAEWRLGSPSITLP